MEPRYNELQKYVDKIKELKDWKSSSSDEETKEYLQKEIDILLTEMKKIVKIKN
jgi:hypothetical protein